MFRNLVVVFLILFFNLSSLSQESENLETLYAKGDQALGNGEYITSMYYFRRILNSDEWESFPRKVDVFYKIGILEESQSNSDAAAKAFGRLMNYLQENPDDPTNRMYYFYALKYGDSLERAGMYKQAADVYWDVLKRAPENQRINILRQLIENYEFHDPSTAEMEELRESVIPQHQLILGWDLADLYRIQGQPEKSVDLLQEIWSVNFGLSRDHVSELVQAYSEANKLKELISDVDEAIASEENPIGAMQLKIDILNEANQGETALQELEAFWDEMGWSGSQENYKTLVDRAPIELVDAWLKLVETYENSEKTIRIARALVEQLPMDVRRREYLSNLLKNNNRIDEAIELWTSWAQQYSNNPMTILNAAEQLDSLGASDAAADLLNSLKQNIPPNLAYRQGQTLMQLGYYSDSFEAFENAVQAKKTTPSGVRDFIMEYAERRDADRLVSALVALATDTSFQDVPAWARDSLGTLGIRQQRYEDLEAIAKPEPNGSWYYTFALEARRQDKGELAKRWLQEIDENDIYHTAAQRELAELYRQVPTIPAQEKAADLFRPSIDGILDTTGEVRLNLSLVDRLMDYAEMRLNAFQPGEALLAIRKVESASSTIGRPLQPVDLDRIKFARARALTQLSDFKGSVPLLESIQHEPYRTNALFLLARVNLALQETEQAYQLLSQIAEQPEHWRRKNDALSLLTAMEPLVGESLELFCTAQLYQLQGRMESADPALRQLAVNHYGEDIEEWARYTIGRLYYQAGNEEAAQKEWERLAVDANHPLIHGMVRYNYLQTQETQAESIQDSTAAQEILIDFPNTLFSDMVRLDYEN